ncbi:MAG: hybrid sensor histidine kinase/response regulator [Candidatus Kapabacteria bacterium]|nr:hybrid sensor histidine kinase/response regulator [Ignavibacteriota bacterium]MCW5885199.1 hybrid sensor histidine kinase/response regulator [Candidatus Kapabacteria bacterium]
MKKSCQKPNMTLDYKPLIFIVDDIPKNIQILTNILTSENYRVAFSIKGQDAFKLAKIINPDLIILDVMMPEYDGFDICKQLKNDKETANIPIIFVTGKSHPIEINRAFDCGAVDYIIKPFNARELLGRVNTHINLNLSKKELSRRNEELVEVRYDLEEALKLKNKFFSIIAHDLRGPFSGFAGLTDLLVNDFEKLEKNEIIEIAEHLNKSSHNLYTLLENLLTWASTQTASLQIKPEIINIFKKVNKVIDVFSTIANNKSIILENQIPEYLDAYTDDKCLDTVLRNLTSNSIKFTQPGGKVTFSSFETDGEILIEVTDTGIGITPEKLKKLFKTGEKVSSPGTNNESGSGLGLMICKELIEVQKGKFEITSDEDRGTKFKFTVKSSNNNS